MAARTALTYDGSLALAMSLLSLLGSGAQGDCLALSGGQAVALEGESPSMRLTGAIWLAEILGWCDARVRAASYGRTYFSAAELQQSSPRYLLLLTSLREHWGEGVARLLERCWGGGDLPAFSDWQAALPRPTSGRSGVQIPKRLGPYAMIRELGKGGMGLVYLARQESLSRELAIKILFPELTKADEFVERFLREGRAAAGLRHPGIVQVFDANVADGFYYIAMEYLGDRTLADLLRLEGGRLPVERVVTLAEQLLDALGHAHEQGVLHRDVKPSNIMVTDRNQAVLTDFSLARIQTAQRLTRTGTLMGTPEYMAPEHYDDTDLDLRADLYAVGITLYQMLTGTNPFAKDTPARCIRAHLMHMPEPPPALASVIMRALAKSRDERYSSAQEMRAALREKPPAENAPGALRVKRPDKTAPQPPAPPSWQELLVAGLRQLRGRDSKAGLAQLVQALNTAERDKDVLRRCLTLYVLGLVYHRQGLAEPARAAFGAAVELWQPAFATAQATATVAALLEGPEAQLFTERLEWSALDATIVPVHSPARVISPPEPPSEPEPPKARWPWAWGRKK